APAPAHQTAAHHPPACHLETPTAHPDEHDQDAGRSEYALVGRGSRQRLREYGASGSLLRHIFGKHILLQLITGNHMLLGGPGAQIDQAAAGRAEGTLGEALVPGNRSLAGGAFDCSGHDHSPRASARYCWCRASTCACSAARSRSLAMTSWAWRKRSSRWACAFIPARTCSSGTLSPAVVRAICYVSYTSPTSSRPVIWYWPDSTSRG